MSVQTPDLGEAQEELAVAYEGDSLEIGSTPPTCSRS
jgi:DNA polymerase III sliding clamp (beta) subunit (PCNA family)